VLQIPVTDAARTTITVDDAVRAVYRLVPLP
jgi:hypothetical protein